MDQSIFSSVIILFNSHNHFSWQHMDIAGRKLILVKKNGREKPWALGARLGRQNAQKMSKVSLQVIDS